jgi:hypothetical protein
MANPGVASSSIINLLPVQAEYDANNNCLGLYGQGGNALYAPYNASSLSIGSNLVASTTLPTISSGFGTNPTITASNTLCFKVVVGTGGAASGTITFPAAPNGWTIEGNDVTGGNSIFLQQTASTATSATLTSYSITTGLAANMTAGDVILIIAHAY